MKISEHIASVRINGAYYPLSCGTTTVGDLVFRVEMENKAEDLYSWVVYLENNSDEKSPRIQEFLGMDMKIPAGDNLRLNTLRGDDCSIRSFYPESFDIREGETITRQPTGARSSNITAFPYFDVTDSDGEGFVCGIGWSGQWKLDVTRKDGEVRFAAGFGDCDFVLEPHEKVRSVRVLLCFGQGGENKLRQKFVRLHRKYYSPIPEFDNDTFFPAAAHCFDRYYWGNMPVSGKLNYFESEDAQLNIIRNAAACRHINSFWLDACWFDGAFRTGVGSYRYSTGFPDGLKKLSDAAHSAGMRFILWFEPVRAMPGTNVYEQFSDDPSKIINGTLVNLGDPEVWQYQFEHIAAVIEENGVDIYRQDFNIDPYEYLRSIETPDRTGMAQIRFTEGLYRLWDALKARFPGLMIDNCSSGGRLIDVETMMRAIPLWRSDMGCRPAPAAMQNEILMLSRYLPYHQGSSFDQSPYFLRSSSTTAVACAFAFLSGIIDPEKEETSLRAVSQEAFLQSDVRHIGNFDTEWIEKALKDVLDLREYWNGDFTALTPPADDRASVLAYTLRLEEEDRGIVLLFRREEAPDTFTVKLPDICPDREYLLTLSDENLVETEMTVTGAELAEGFNVKIDTAPGSLLIRYKAR